MQFHAIPYIQEIFIILAAAGIIVPLLARLRISPILGYLLIGLAVGPFGLGSADLSFLAAFTIQNPEDVAYLAEFGIVFLLFMIGLELSPTRLWDMRKLVFGLGFLQVALSTGILSFVIFAFLQNLMASIVLASCLSLSSTAMVMQILMERRKLATPLGRTSVSILLFQDLAVVPMLIFLGVYGAGAMNDLGFALLLAFLKAVAVVAIILIAGYFILRPLFRLAGGSSSAEPFMAITLLTLMTAAIMTGMAGLSMALGAFLAGLLLAETEYRHAIEVYIEPFKSLLIGIFFMTVGMGLDIGMVWNNIFWLCIAVITLILVKAAIIAGLARVFGLTWGRALETGLLLGQAGEFAFVIVGSAMTLGLIVPELGHFVLVMTGLSMMLTPGMSVLARKLRVYLEKNITMFEPAPAVTEMQGHVIVAGVGRIGDTITRILDAESIPYLCIDGDAEVVEEQRKQGREIYYGDASRRDFLKSFHPERALAIVLTMDDVRSTAEAIKNVLGNWPNVPVYARARDMRVARLLRKAGAAMVIAETVEASLQITGHLLKGIGIEDDVIRRRLELERERPD